MFLAIAGALVDRRVEHEIIPVLCRSISEAADSSRDHGDRYRSAQSTVELSLADSHYTGMDDLRKRWPKVATVIDESLEEEVARIRRRRSADAGEVSAEDATKAISRSVQDAGDGVTVVIVSGGIDATSASVDAATTRAAKQHVSPDADGMRAPIQSKTGIALPTHQNAIECASVVRGLGVDVKRFFSPPSLKKPKANDTDHDEYECRYKESADAIVRGGQNVKLEFCDGRHTMPCAFRSVCLAAEGVMGPKHSRVATSNHASMNVLSSASGTTGTLIVHDPPNILSTLAVSYEEMIDTHKDLDLFEDRYVAAMRPALSVMTAWVREIGAFYTSSAIEDVFIESADALDPEELGNALAAMKLESFGDAIVDALCCVRASRLSAKGNDAPPVRRVQMLQARQNKSLALRIGNASRVLYMIWCACTRVDTPYSLMITPKGRSRVLSATGPRDPYITALTRQGSTVVIGKNVDLAAIEKVAGHAPRVHRIRVAPTADVERMMLKWTSGTRRNLLDRNGQLRPRFVLGPLDQIASWLRARSWIRSCAVMTFDFLSLICRYAKAHEDSKESAAIEEIWRAHGHSVKALRQSAREVAPALVKLPGEVVWTHFGANEDLQRFEALATLGNPFSSQARTRAESAYLDLDRDGMRQRQKEQCAVILAQAHDAVAYGPHPRVALLHLGEVPPAGPGWPAPAPASENGRPPRADAVPTERFKALLDQSGKSLSYIAERLGVSKGTLSKYATGRLSVSTALFQSLKKLTERL